jgi:hypothetical protein
MHYAQFNQYHKEEAMVRIDGFGALVSLVIVAALLYMAYSYGKTGSPFNWGMGGMSKGFGSQGQ